MSHILMYLTVGLAFADDPKEAAAKRDIAFLEGEWVMIAAQRDGTIPPRFIVRGARRSARGNESTVIMGGRVYMKSTYTLDPTKNPKSIDYDVLEGEFRGQKQQGIYEIEGNTVTFCFANPGLPRPTDFTAGPGSGRSFSTWQKISGPPVTQVQPTPTGDAKTGAVVSPPAQPGCRCCLFKRLRLLRCR